MSGPDRRTLTRGGWIALCSLAVIVRARDLHRGLIYPDGYQYLLMAKAIAAHLTPVLRLGHGGELFVPSVDASLKPLLPALTALLSPVVGLRPAADVLTVAGGAATVVLTGVLAARLTRSQVAGLAAGLAALLSPALGYWTGFTGPDPLAQALALGTVLAVLDHRHRTAGALGALCIAARPEWAVVFVGAALAGLFAPGTRRTAATALIAGAFVLSALIALLRPPIAVPAGGPGLLALALAAGAALPPSAGLAARGRRWMRPIVALAAVGLACARLPALASGLGAEWPLAALACIGIVASCLGERAREALLLAGALLLLAAIYGYRNPHSGRYAAQLMPLVCVAAGMAAAIPVPATARRWRLAPPLGASALVGLLALIAPGTPQPADDAFATLAQSLARAPAGMLVSAAPDAYGLLLPGRAQSALRPGVRGLVLLDAAQRAYDPGLSASGTVVARLSPPQGFERPDGTIDHGGAVLIRGVVVSSG